LLSASIISTTATSSATAGTPAGTLVRYVFDEPVNGGTPPVFTNFKLYDYTLPAVPYLGSAGANSTVDPTNANAVFVNFQGVTTATAAQNLTLATVIPGAVTDLQGQSNPDGDAAVGTSHTNASSAGVTAAPNLESVAAARASTTVTNSALDVTFDKPTFDIRAGATETAGFFIVYSDQAAEVACTAPGASNANNGTNLSSAGNNGTATLTIVCPNDPNTPNSTLTSAQVSRIVVKPSTVSTAAAAGTVAVFLQASDAPHLATASPSLTGAQLTPATTSGNPDQILFTFDQAVNAAAVAPAGTAPVATDFFAVLSNGTQVPGSVATRSTSSANQVLVTFAVGTDATAVSGAVSIGGVSAVAIGQLPNQDDEIAATNAATVTITPGLTAGPVLTAATVFPVKDSFGTIVGYGVVYTFNQSLGTVAPVAANLHAYDSDGTLLTCGTIAPAPYPSTTAPATATCVSFGAATINQAQTAVLATTDFGAVSNAAGAPNPEGAVATTGGTGTPQFG